MQALRLAVLSGAGIVALVETVARLQVRGRVDVDTERGCEVWRQVKANRVGFSFGFMTRKAHDHDDGRGRVIADIDLFEVSVTPAPANNYTRVLATKKLGGRQLADLPCALVGTAWDPVFADGHSVMTNPVRRDDDIEALRARASRRARGC